MSEKSGLLNYDVLYQNGFNQPQSCTSEDLKKTMDDLYRKVTGIIEDNIHLLKAIAENLLLRETLEEKDLKLIMEAS
jgi:cell division protease FtsH